MAGWSPPWRVCVREFNSMSCTCTRARTLEEPRRWETRGDAAHARTPTRGVTGKGGLVGETTGSATRRSWQLFPRWADRSAGRIQPSRAPSIMAPFSSFPYLRQHGWHGFLSLLGPILRHEQRRAVYPSLWTEWRQSYIPSSGDVASHGVIADTRPAVDRNPSARGAAIATQTVTPICYSIHYATPVTGIAELCESAIRFLWYMTGSTRFSTAPGASGFSDRPVIARPRNYKLYVIHDAWLVFIVPLRI